MLLNKYDIVSGLYIIVIKQLDRVICNETATVDFQFFI